MPCKFKDAAGRVCIECQEQTGKERLDAPHPGLEKLCAVTVTSRGAQATETVYQCRLCGARLMHKASPIDSYPYWTII